MFETMDQNQRSNSWKRVSMLLISAGAHMLAILALIVLPLIFFTARGDLMTWVIATPLAPPPVPAPQPPIYRKAVASDRVLITSGPLVPPNKVPKGVPPPPEGPVSTDVTGMLGDSLDGVSGLLFGPGGPGGPAGPGFGPPVAVAPSLPPPPKPTAHREPVRRGGDVLVSKLVRKVDPVFPHLAKISRVQAVVILQVIVDEEGNVSDVKVLRGHPLFDEAAVQAVQQWKYSPTFLNGEPVPVTGAVTVIFSLR